MSDQPGIKELLIVQGLTTISSRELAELRAELEWVQGERDEQRRWAKDRLNDALYWKARAEKAEADLEKAYAQHDPAMLKMLERAEKAEGANVALREGLLILHGYVEHSSDPLKMEMLNLLDALYGSPDPGAKVRAVVEAARRYVNDSTIQDSTELDEAVRALRGEEGGCDAA